MMSQNKRAQGMETRAIHPQYRIRQGQIEVFDEVDGIWRLVIWGNPSPSSRDLSPPMAGVMPPRSEWPTARSPTRVPPTDLAARHERMAEAMFNADRERTGSPDEFKGHNRLNWLRLARVADVARGDG